MWVRRTKEQFRRAAIRKVKAYVLGIAISFLGGTCIRYYRASGNNPFRHPPIVIWIASAIMAAAITICAFSIEALSEWLHIDILPFSPGVNSRDMLCTRCWLVQDYSPKLICGKCGGVCEDAKFWTWIDDEKTEVTPKDKPNSKPKEKSVKTRDDSWEDFLKKSG
jgi:hypothetical protein